MAFLPPDTTRVHSTGKMREFPHNIRISPPIYYLRARITLPLKA